MPHPKTRGERRAANDRQQAARTRYYRRANAYLAKLMPYHCMGGVTPDAEAISQAQGRRMRDLRAPCSCIICGNARKHRGPPIQERRLTDAENTEEV